MNILRQFHDVVSEQQISLEEKINQLLRFGNDVFGLDIAIVSDVKGALYTVKYAQSKDNAVPVGVTFPVGETYCCHTLRSKKATGFHHTGESEIATHPCYLNLKLEAYIGAPIFEGGQAIGTVNFSSPKSRDPFTADEIDYIELFAQWLGLELSRQKNTDMLKKSDINLAKLERTANIGTWEVDVESNTLWWSNQTKAIHQVPLDYRPDLEKAMSFYRDEDSRDSISKAVQVAIETGKSWNLELPLISAMGNEVWVYSQGEAEFENNKCVRLFGVTQDITRSRIQNEQLTLAKEKAEEASIAKSEFLSNMSHEIRTPMNGILGTLQLLERASIDAESEGLVSKALYSSKTLLTIINDILDYSKIEANKLTLEATSFSMHEVLESVENDLIEEANKKGIDFIIEVGDGFIDGWKGDSVRVKQILLNLVSNAVKFTHVGNVAIKVAHAQCHQQPALVMEVSDTGIGMSDDAQVRIFERFSQADTSTTRRFGGTGLGMSITIRLVKLMNGEMEVKSIEGKGTQVKVLLPLKPAKLLSAGQQSLQEGPPNLKGINILIAEDNEINREIITSMLESTHANLSHAENGKKAVELFATGTFDLVLMDIQMPEMDGVEAYLNIKQMNQATPVVALTANVMKDEVQKYLELGFISHIGKPLDMNKLYAELNRLLT